MEEQQQIEQLLKKHGFQTIKKIGRGAFGQALLVYNPYPEVGFVAAKVMKNEDLDINEWNVAANLSKDPALISPFIIRFIAAKQDQEYQMTILLMEFANLGTLFDVIKTQKDIPIPMIRVIMRQILEGLCFIHSKNIIHRDIKGGNIMMHSVPGSGKVILKIADFGEVKQISQSSQNQMKVSGRGTPQYMAPELYLGIGIANVKADVWSLGMLLYQMLTHTFPFYPLSDKEIRQFLRKGVLNRPSSIRDNTLWDLIVKMLNFDPKTRISAAKALEHLFFTNYWSN
ncbi:MAG: putative Spindle assembly checkpoint kinase [Streblomastix strix]|uniref:Putative Spindle assembly checkpoint kinase n=1 Tax=Streblomastix strix TaxID=222440 RepID=A0A5J4URL9_9EUKA|nr:MAG: putative Spindle assembly checkpoint kinase [Streblomastix strix]